MQARLHLSIRCRIDMSVAKVRTPRGAWVDAALQALAAGGPDAVRVEALAACLGVSKGGFYWHFTDRQALLDEMLDTWEKAVVEDVIARVESQPADPRAKLQHLFELAPSVDFRRRAGPPGLVAARPARSPSGCAGSTTGAWSTCARCSAQFCADEDDVEARSMLAFSLFIGSYFIAAAARRQDPVRGAAARDRPTARASRGS